MSAPKITEQEKQILRNNAKTELERLEACLSDQGTVQLLDMFKNKFNICESVYKVILAEHQKRKGKPASAYLKVYMTQVPYALDFAGYTFERTFALMHVLVTFSRGRRQTIYPNLYSTYTLTQRLLPIVL